MAEWGTAGEARDQTDGAGLAVFLRASPCGQLTEVHWACSGSVLSGSQGLERMTGRPCGRLAQARRGEHQPVRSAANSSTISPIVGDFGVTALGAVHQGDSCVTRNPFHMQLYLAAAATVCRARTWDHGC